MRHWLHGRRLLLRLPLWLLLCLLCNQALLQFEHFSSLRDSSKWGQVCVARSVGVEPEWISNTLK